MPDAVSGRALSGSSPSTLTSITTVSQQQITVTTTSTSTSIPTYTSASATPQAASNNVSGPKSSPLLFIIAVVLGVVVIIGIIASMFWSNRRRNKRYEQSNPDSVARNAPENTRWWNRIARPNVGAAELSAGQGQYHTVELRGSEPEPVYELPAGSVRGGVEGNSVTSGAGIRYEGTATGGGEERNNGLARVNSRTSLEILEEARSLAAGQEIPRGGRTTTGSKSVLGEEQLAALAGAFAPPPMPKPPPQRTGPWQYR